MQHVVVEVCAGSVADAVAAEIGGAHRVELNSAVPLGGLTPSTAVLELVKTKTQLPVITMVRPRPGNFVYDELEFETLQREFSILMENGADGIAVGITDHSGNPDRSRLEKLVKQSQTFAARCELVYHRAIDIAPDWKLALQHLVDLGFHRVLTSGQQRTALDGANCIAEMVSEFGNRIEIVAGSGIAPDHVEPILEKTGCRQIHGSFSTMDHVFQTAVGDFGSVSRTDSELVRAVVEVSQKT